MKTENKIEILFVVVMIILIILLTIPFMLN